MRSASTWSVWTKPRLAELVREGRPRSLAVDDPAPDPTDLAARLSRETAGHPLYATQLLRHWDESEESAAPTGGAIPRTLRDLVWSRVDALGPDATDVLMAAAVLGQEFDESVLVEMVDVGEAVVVASLEDAVRGGLLTELETPARTVRFVHALVVNALYSDLGGGRRTRLHARAAQALTGRRNPTGSSGLVSLARHCAARGPARRGPALVHGGRRRRVRRPGLAGSDPALPSGARAGREPGPSGRRAGRPVGAARRGAGAGRRCRRLRHARSRRGPGATRSRARRPGSGRAGHGSGYRSRGWRDVRAAGDGGSGLRDRGPDRPGHVCRARRPPRPEPHLRG